MFRHPRGLLMDVLKSQVMRRTPSLKCLFTQMCGFSAVLRHSVRLLHLYKFNVVT